MNAQFKPAWWLPGPHFQTLWPTLAPRKIQIPLYNERLELPDGDFLDLSWVRQNNQDKSSSKPIVVVLHGLNGSIHSPYAKGIMQAIHQQGFRCVLMHFRGCSGVPNRLPRSYHSGETNDLNTVISELIKREKNTPIYAVGYSLGGNVLLKWLGETGNKNPLKAAVAISVPFELAKTADRLNQGFSKVYQWGLIRELIKLHKHKFKIIPAPIHFGDIDKFRTFWDFDNNITAPLHGFKSAEDYYQQSSCRQYLGHVDVPTLILHAINDPFTTVDSLPTPKEITSKISLEIMKEGGHVGFVTGKTPWQPIYWLERKIIQFLKQQDNFLLASL